MGGTDCQLYMQVVLCSWMMTAALVEAQKVGIATSASTLVCNGFNPSSKGIAFVLWVFYLSKVRYKLIASLYCQQHQQPCVRSWLL